MPAPSKLTAKSSERFCSILRKGGSVSKAAHHAGFTLRSAFRYKNSSESFASAWISAKEEGTDLLEDVCLKFATVGFVEYSETKFLKDGTKIVTERRRVSERLLEAILRSRRPERWSQKTAMEHSGIIEHTTARDRVEGKLASLSERIIKQIDMVKSGKDLPDDDEIDEDPENGQKLIEPPRPPE